MQCVYYSKYSNKYLKNFQLLFLIMTNITRQNPQQLCVRIFNEV